MSDVTHAMARAMEQAIAKREDKPGSSWYGEGFSDGWTAALASPTVGDSPSQPSPVPLKAEHPNSGGGAPLDRETLARVIDNAICPFGCVCGKDHSPRARHLRVADAVLAHLAGPRPAA